MGRSLRGALVGYGFIAEHGHAPEYQRLATTGSAQIQAIADVTEARREAARKAFPNARLYENYADLLATEASKLDFVDVTTPPYAHAEVAEAALAHGLHVLCEKPLAVSARQAESMAARAESEKRVLFPCHNYRHAPVVEEVRSILRKDVIGPVRLATLQTFRTTHARGVAEWRPDWRRERDLAGGGIGMDHGSHTFYLAFEWLRSYPTSVTAKIGASGDNDTEDNFSCTLTFPTGIVTAHLTWTSGARKVYYTLHGSRGAITVDDDVVSVHRIVGAAGVSSELVYTREVASRWMDASHREWFGRLFEDFRRSIREGDYVSDQTMDAILCVETIGAAYESASLGSREVAIPGQRSMPPFRRLVAAGGKVAHGTLR
jgi:predicted dehydrogenase